MTLSEALARVPRRDLPGFWVGRQEDVEAHLSRLRNGSREALAVTPGGRSLDAVAFGAAEDLPQRANFNSAIGGRQPAAYRDRAARTRPVVLFVGPVHGQETEGLTGLMNLVHLLDTGTDLRGREHPALRDLAARCRLLIVPAGNPDGVARFAPESLQGMEHDDVRFWGQGTWPDGSFCGWPECKRRHPMPLDGVGFPGCYFNDAGINPMHDEFFEPMGPEAPAILRLARREAPDLACSLHSHSTVPAVLRPAYLPREVQEDVNALARGLYAMLTERGLPHGAPFTPQIEQGAVPAPFNLTSALYHVSGATSFTFECPHGLRGERACAVDHAAILDIQLTLYEAMLRHALGLTPPSA
ncbi:MAG: hypothetical protein JXR77_10885 [Lentisphaeria bacterium]|nr:hypothetical protein [Lentisphaeria bacterium]